MLFLLFSVLCSVLIANLLMLFGRSGKLNMLPIFLGNYFIASLFSFEAWNHSQPSLSSFDLLFGILAGALFLANFWVYQASITYNGLSLSVGVMRVAMIIPVLLAVTIFGEKLKLTGLAGIALAVAAFALKADPKELHNFLWLLGLFAVSGLTDASLKVYKELGSGAESAFVWVIFSSAFVLTLIVILLGRIRFSYQSLLFGFALGLPNRLSTVFFLKGLDTVPASLAYPLVAVSVVVLSIGSDMVFWKKKARSKEVLLWALLLISLLLLNL
ncbi:MAG TPA: hypothetical protein PLX59_05100 [Candidatus Cloacimonadota bacterium]|nr:hypothetical protein [Candidatus Cloacimonadota bacterium]